MGDIEDMDHETIPCLCTKMIALYLPLEADSKALPDASGGFQAEGMLINLSKTSIRPRA